MERKFPLRIEEVPVVGRFIYESYDRDFSFFSSYSTKYVEAHKNLFRDKLVEVEHLVYTKIKVAETSKITQIIYDTEESLKRDMTWLEGYIKRVTVDMTVLLKDFGISDVRFYIDNKDHDALLRALSIVIHNIDDNRDAIDEIGMTAEFYDNLVAKTEKIRSDYALRNRKENETDALVQDNMVMLNNFWDIVADVCDAGKRIFKYDDEQKTHDYTVVSVLKRIRHTVKKVVNEEVL